MGPRIFGFEFFEILHESRKLAFGGSIAVNYNGMIFESVGENLTVLYSDAKWNIGKWVIVNNLYL
jgi:hypothetical protein